MIAIVDYGLGNLKNVKKAFERVGKDAVITGDRARIQAAERIVLPGVGAFRDAISLLRRDGLDKVLIDEARAGKPLLGICLGMHMLFERSLEGGVYDGLGLIDGEITRFNIDEKVPQVGWNSVKTVKPSRIFKDSNGEYFYFVHSYCAAAIDGDTSGVTEYGVEFTSAVERDNIFGLQFHPERSGDVGLRLLKNFAEIEI